MADHAEDDFFDGGDIFIYRRGRQVPQHVTHVRIHESVDEIEDDAFYERKRLVQVDTHDGIRRVGKRAFTRCKSLRRINLKSVVEINLYAFVGCANLESVEFGDYLETIGNAAFYKCYALKTPLKLPSITTIEQYAFNECKCFVNIELSERLETIERGAFHGCERLQRITIPLKRDLLEFSAVFQRYTQFDECYRLTTVDLVGGIHKTVASLHMESWRTETIAEINRINQVLPSTPDDEKTNEIQQWMESLLDKMDHYKAEHYVYVKEGISLLELSLWKAKLGEEDICGERAKKVKVDAASARKGKRITCGADIVIKNVLPFLQLE